MFVNQTVIKLIKTIKLTMLEYFLTNNGSLECSSIVKRQIVLEVSLQVLQ